MQHIPDKEFDKLFKDKFEDAEIMPSANLWTNIEKELAPKKKRIIPIYWMAAASVVIAVGAILFFQKKEVIQLHGEDPSEVVELKSSVAPFTLPPSTKEAIKPAQSTASQTATVAVKAENKEEPAAVNATIKNNQPEKSVALQPNTNNGHLPVKQQDPKPIDVLPVKEAAVENPVVIASAQVTEKVEAQNINETGSERKGIRNVGDLVNFVVDKVDKREKKLVRFNTDDDDNSSIIGINIGFLKLNKRNKDK